MNPQLLEILKKAKAIDKAAEKFDNGAPKKTKSGGLYDQMDGTKLISAEEAGRGSMNESSSGLMNIKKDVGSEGYNRAVTNSKLPAAIQKAMLENPIPQPDMGFDVDEESIRELRGTVVEDNGPYYSEEDEIDMYEKPVRRTQTQQPQRKKVIREEVEPSVDINEAYLRKLIASELTKALPKVIEHYFDKRLVKENVQFKAGSTIFSGTVMPMPKVKGKNNI